MAPASKQSPRLSPLIDDYLYHFDRVREFYNGDFREPEVFERQAQRVQSRQIPREALADVLKSQNESYGCGPETLGRIERIVRDRAGAVVTGQQVGLFSGPLYTIYKALTAIRLSEQLNRRHPGSFVPVFWLASDDHDLAEIDHIALLDKSNRPREIRCQMPASESKIPASNLILPPNIRDCLRQLKELTLDSEFKVEVIGQLSEAYEPGRSFVESFARWMTRLFKSAGLIFIDPSHPRLKEMGKEVFYREIASESASTKEAVAASERLRQAGYSAQVPLHEGILNIFYVDPERRAIQWKDGAFSIKGRQALVRKEDLLTRAREKPFSFSPNVILRPIYQDFLLPTVAYIGGPGEIAYFAQMKGVYETFGLPMPVICPRPSLTIVEKNIDRILRKYKLEVSDIWRSTAGVTGEIAKKQIPGSLDAAVRLLYDQVERGFESLEGEIMSFEPTLKATVDQAKEKMIRQLKFTEKKILQAAAKQNETTIRQLRRAVNSLYPNQHLQERVFNIVPYLIKYGYAFMDKLGRAANLDEPDHQILLIQ